MRRARVLLCWLLLVQLACREKYVAATNDPATGYLVVEGFINSGTGATTITLTRATKLSVTTITKETKAVVKIEAKNTLAAFSLTETGTGTGVYSNPQLTLDASDQYRVHITTLAGKQYVSDYSVVRKTVNIDSITWWHDNGGVQVGINSHDALNKTRYYLYTYDETWEFHSTFYKILQVYNNRAGQPDHVGYFDSLRNLTDTLKYKCWKSFSSVDILVNSTEKLTQDVVSRFPLSFIEGGSWKLSVLYSINVKQRATSQQAYRFYQQLRTNTQQLGSIFDAQPSDNYGNIQCLTDPNELAFGFVEVTEEKQQRIFITSAQANWSYYPACGLDQQVSVLNTPDSIRAQSGSLPTMEDPDVSAGSLIRVMFAPTICVDCTLRGTNTKPSFWP